MRRRCKRHDEQAAVYMLRHQRTIEATRDGRGAAADLEAERPGREDGGQVRLHIITKHCSLFLAVKSIPFV